ncbi:hypothetical protein CBM2623_A150067 [Cupriavidus taiwanensis]|nr:hypothetical protein CBM2608_A150067 [Cupriavidus taiwanensis]SPA25818.1 hypothetical protein CBM2623_A150067 [Cupriavidus taiwanensis]
MVVGPDDRAMVPAARGTAMRHRRSHPGGCMLMSRQCMAAALLALGCTAAGAQHAPAPAPDAAGAIAEACRAAPARTARRLPPAKIPTRPGAPNANR